MYVSSKHVFHVRLPRTLFRKTSTVTFYIFSHNPLELHNVIVPPILTSISHTFVRSPSALATVHVTVAASTCPLTAISPPTPLPLFFFFLLSSPFLFSPFSHSDFVYDSNCICGNTQAKRKRRRRKGSTQNWQTFEGNLVRVYPTPKNAVSFIYLRWAHSHGLWTAIY